VVARHRCTALLTPLPPHGSHRARSRSPAATAAPGTRKAHFIDACEWVYLLIFTVELLAKILAYGFWHNEHAYLKDAWCQLDFVVVSLAWAPILFPQLNHLSVVRSVRALRPLRALKRVPGMPVLVNSILAALPQLR
jgi:hypothetical protein